MKTLIVYYSLEGNTEWTTQQLAAELSADTLRLVPKKTYPDKGFAKFFWGGKSAVTKEAPELEPYSVDLSGYECVILATPVWAGTFAPPLRTFIQSENLAGKQFAFAACSGGGSTAKTFSGLKTLLGVSGDVPELSLVDPKTAPNEENSRKIAEFCQKLSMR